MTNRRKMRRSVQRQCFAASAIVCSAIACSAIACSAIACLAAVCQEQLSPACDDTPMSTACPRLDGRA
ncbi:MAG TPA: hypothetical protein VFS67_24725 [Polyangiaceae bacterium]|nr:hypothetical protein [Polyangiaceae bacterium]